MIQEHPTNTSYLHKAMTLTLTVHINGYTVKLDQYKHPLGLIKSCHIEQMIVLGTAHIGQVKIITQIGMGPRKSALNEQLVAFRQCSYWADLTVCISTF